MIRNYIAGTLELSSKVRYGLSSRGVPLFRFVPYDKSLSPFAVGCSTRDLFYNVHAIITPEPRSPLIPPSAAGPLPRGLLVQNLGKPTPESEQTVLLTTYAYDSQKELRKETTNSSVFPSLDNRVRPEGFTFHIDPPGCKDVDDALTMIRIGEDWLIWIHIADVAAWVPEGSHADLDARRRATTFYSPSGEALAPMFPRALSEAHASLKTSGEEKPALSVSFLWNPTTRKLGEFHLHETAVQCERSFTYEEAAAERNNIPELDALAELTGSDDSHTWIEYVMILYNTCAGDILKRNQCGILRRHAGTKAEFVETLPRDLAFLANEAAEYCLSTDENTVHKGLLKESYAYASSPLRRYADLFNQRCLHSILRQQSVSATDSTLVSELNRREKQSKAFQRDLFFSTALQQNDGHQQEEGIVLSFDTEKRTHRVYVPAWKRLITVKQLLAEPFPNNTVVAIRWYEDRSKVGWKDKICFSLCIIPSFL